MCVIAGQVTLKIMNWPENLKSQDHTVVFTLKAKPSLYGVEHSFIRKALTITTLDFSGHEKQQCDF